jgi:hypothetical protein
MPTEAEAKPLPGLEGAAATPPERVPARTREGRITLAAWRMHVSTPGGPGAIMLVETNVGAVFRGEGMFLGWTQENLAAAYQALIPRPTQHEPSMLDGPQLG